MENPIQIGNEEMPNYSSEIDVSLPSRMLAGNSVLNYS